MTANAWKLLVRCLEDGVAAGVRAAYQHSDAPPPTPDQIDRIVDETVREVGEWFTFPPDPDAA